MIDSKTRAEVFERDGHKCKNCGVTDDLTIDHIVPKDHAGTDRKDNLQVLCMACNRRKGTWLQLTWLQRIKRLWFMPEFFENTRLEVKSVLSSVHGIAHKKSAQIKKEKTEIQSLTDRMEGFRDDVDKRLNERKFFEEKAHADLWERINALEKYLKIEFTREQVEVITSYQNKEEED